MTTLQEDYPFTLEFTHFNGRTKLSECHWHPSYQSAKDHADELMQDYYSGDLCLMTDDNTGVEGYVFIRSGGLFISVGA